MCDSPQNWQLPSAGTAFCRVPASRSLMAIIMNIPVTWEHRGSQIRRLSDELIVIILLAGKRKTSKPVPSPNKTSLEGFQQKGCWQAWSRRAAHVYISTPNHFWSFPNTFHVCHDSCFCLSSSGISHHTSDVNLFFSNQLYMQRPLPDVLSHNLLFA